MTALLDFIAAHWVQWLFALATTALAAFCRDISRRLKEEQAKNEAISTGVQALLRESIVNAYNRYSETGYCPIYAKESLSRAYQAYHGLEGNDVATKLYKTLMAMPEEPERRNDDIE